MSRNTRTAPSLTTSRAMAMLTAVAVGLAAPSVAAQTHTATSLRYGMGAFAEARGADAALTNPALAALGDQPRASAGFFGLAGAPRASLGLIRGLVGNAWGRDDANLTSGTTDGLVDFGRFGDTPRASEVQWIGAHSGTMAISLQTAAIARGRWDARTTAALRGDAEGLGTPGVIDEGSHTDLAVVSTAAIGFAQGNGAYDELPNWWSGVSMQASYVHLREEQIGQAVTVGALRNSGSRLDLSNVSDDARATRLDRVRLEGGWIWSAGFGGAWKVGRAGVFGLHGAHLVQLNRSRRADPYAGSTTFLLRDDRGLVLERATDRLTADSSESLRLRANALAAEQRWTPTINGTFSTDLNGPIRRLSVGATIPLDSRPSLDQQARELGASVVFSSGWMPRLHYVQNATHGALLAGAWTVGTCTIRVDAGAGHRRGAQRGDAEWMAQFRITIAQRDCASYRPDA